MKKQLTYIAACFLFSGMVMAQKINLDQMPKPGPTPTINITSPKSFKLKNGLTVMVVENHKLPKVNVTLSMDRPPIYEGNITGVSSILAEQLGNGTAKMSKDEFNKRVDFLGASINFGPVGGSANTLSKYFPEVLGMMADAAINPKFDATEVNKSKDRTIEGLKASEKSAQAIADKVSSAITYGKNTPLGEFETEQTIKSIQVKDVQDYYNKYFAPNNAYLVIVGDVKFEDVKKQVESTFGAWKASSTKIPVPAGAKNVAKTEINLIDVPSAVQSVISVENISTLQMKDPQFFAGSIANYILGGGGEGRLFMNLREKNGFTYGAYSSLTTSKYSPSFSASASVRNEVTDKAVSEFLNELNGIRTIKADELESAKAKLKGDFIRSMERPATIARFAVNSEVHNLPKDFYTNYLKSIDKVTVADVQNAAKSYILPNQSRIFVTGKATDVADSLEKLGYTVNYYDKDANKIAKPVAQKVDVTIAKVVENYINAIGGKAAAEKINSVAYDASASMQGMALDMKKVVANDGKKLMTISMMGNVMQKIAYDGKEGSMSVQGQNMPLPADVKKSFDAEKQAIPELGFADNKDLKIVGVEKFNNEDSYAVKAGSTTHYYSVKTGLKTGMSQTQKMGEQEVTIPETYSNYKDVNGIKMPFTISQSMMGQDIKWEVKGYQINQAKDSDFK